MDSKQEAFKKQSVLTGLSEEEVRQRQKKYGLNSIRKKRINILTVLLRQFTSNPLIIILALATGISFSLGQQVSAYYIFGIIIASVLLGFFNEYSAEKTVDNLLKKISQTVLVIRDNEKKEIPASFITIGDVIFLAPGSLIPADVRFLETNRLEVDESVLTGESQTVYKDAQDAGKKQLGFMGTSIVSGSAKAEVIAVGKATAYGKIAQEATFVRPITQFQKGLMQFGRLIIVLVSLFTVGIFIINALLGHQLLESLLFSLAIAVGLTPELLPVIVTISLSHGAGKLAKKHVVAKQLIAIENLGNMDILCTDKTGTLTEGKLTIQGVMDMQGKTSKKVLLHALLCNDVVLHSKMQSETINKTIWQYALDNNIVVDKAYTKIAEIPFDYNKRAMFTVVKKEDEYFLIVKGAPEAVLSWCTHHHKEYEKKLHALNKQGIRSILIATKKVHKKASYGWEDVHQLLCEGYVTFSDAPKKTTAQALERLEQLHVAIKIITGDNAFVAQKIAEEVHLPINGILTGDQITKVAESEFALLVEKTTLFAQVTPEQKMKIIYALQRNGHTVGYMGDGINDIPSLHTADVGISVNDAIDVAKNAAGIVLLQKNLHVVADGIIEGRKTFTNTIKYILMATSSNFGNMFSAAGASFFLPFLPMTPVQILLTNSLYDVSQMSIPSDTVDPESLILPRKWDIQFLRDYMVCFGPISSLFDFATFGIMLFFFHAKASLFQTGWFIESMATEILVIFVIRTSRTPFFKSRPSVYLIIMALLIVLVACVLPVSPFAKSLGFVPLPLTYFGMLVFLVLCYLALVEGVKHVFLKKYRL